MNSTNLREREAFCYCPACGEQNRAAAVVLTAGINCKFCQTGFVPEKVELVPELPTTKPKPAKGQRFMVALAVLGILIIAISIGISLANPMSDARENLGRFGFVVLGLAVYILPAYTAYQRAHRNFEAITVLNILGGWTVIGWIVALVWAVTKSPDPARN